MPKAPLLALATLLLSSSLLAASPVEPLGSDAYERAWSDLLGRAVTTDGLVRYDLIAGPLRDDFEEVVTAIGRFDASTLETDAEKLAFWINAYNVKMVERVLAAGIPANIERAGFDTFFETPVRVAGRAVTLDQIEHVILRRLEGPAGLDALAVERLDPRIHVGLNCGAVACPRLRAFAAANVGAELDRAMHEFVNSPRHARFEGGTAVLSSLLDWFGSDFDSTGEPAGDYLLGFMAGDRPDADRLRRLFEGRSAAELKALSNVRFSYDWDLNAANG